MDRSRNFPLGIEPFTFGDLYDPARLRLLSARFDDELAHADPAAAEALAAWRGGTAPEAAAQSELLLQVASAFGRFVATLFAVDADERRGAADVAAHGAIYAFKAQFIDKRVRRRKPPFAEPLTDALHARLAAAWAAPRLQGNGASWNAEERAEAEAAHVALEALRLWGVVDARPAASPERLEAARAELSAALGRTLEATDLREELVALLGALEAWHAARLSTSRWVSYRQPQPLGASHADRVATASEDPALPEALDGPAARRRARLGFDLTDDRMRAREALAEVDYCLLCHPRGKDSCRDGLRDKAGAVRQTPLGAQLGGCPLDQRISEAHTLLGRGERIAALAMVMRDNPMCPGTGHRICNDCMKACIFQKQTPVNVPQVETHLLGEVLALPYGFEIYALLTRLNPLRERRPYPLPYHGHNVLVVGLGPAGYTLAHYLLCEGFGVAGIDGLKLEPMAAELLGTDVWPPRAVRDVTELQERLGRRVAQGFGGVAEYGITVRWDKNFLKVIYLNLLRWQTFAAFGGVRLGSTLNLDDAWKLGFDHAALAAGAGRPTMVPLKNNLMRGMRAASDFLMGLQLTGAFRPESLANLQVELPAVVIGGGLTAVDTATELAAYYPVQVRKVRLRVAALGEARVRKTLDREENEVLTRMLGHAEELARAEAEGTADLPALVRRWGGVKVAYRRGLTDSPAYRLNHEEVEKALEEGITFVEHVTPLAAVPDAYNHVEGLQVRRRDGSTTVLPARSVIVAAGTTPNTIYAREYPGAMVLDGAGRFFQAHELAVGAPPAEAPAAAAPAGDAPSSEGVHLQPGEVPAAAMQRPPTFTTQPSADVPLRPLEVPLTDVHVEPTDAADAAPAEVHLRPVDAPAREAFFTSYLQPRADAAERPLLPPHTVSFFGDNHPAYAGNVVRAMASAKHGHRAIVHSFAEARARALGQPQAAVRALSGQWQDLVTRLRDTWEARVVGVRRLTPTIVEVVVHAPAQARAFRPGQFFRLQNFEVDAPRLGDTPLNMENLALTGAWVDAERGEIAMVALEMGVSSRLCAQLTPGQQVVLMGPTGAATEVPEGETVLLCGGGLGNAVLFSVARALRARGNRVLYFAAYRTALDMYKQDEVEAASDQVVWSVDGGPLPAARRPQDRAFTGNIVQALTAFAEGKLGESVVALGDVDRIITIGSDRMMAAVAHARRASLAPYLKPQHEAIASINSPMQCMMKEVCAQCLQRHVDPVTGEESFVFSCFNQDQPQDRMDWEHLAGRLRQNTLMEKISGMWLDNLLQQASLPEQLAAQTPQPVA